MQQAPRHGFRSLAPEEKKHVEASERICQTRPLQNIEPNYWVPVQSHIPCFGCGIQRISKSEEVTSRCPLFRGMTLLLKKWGTLFVVHFLSEAFHNQRISLTFQNPQQQNEKRCDPPPPGSPRISATSVFREAKGSHRAARRAPRGALGIHTRWEAKDAKLPRARRPRIGSGGAGRSFWGLGLGFGVQGGVGVRGGGLGGSVLGV